VNRWRAPAVKIVTHCFLRQ